MSVIVCDYVCECASVCVSVRTPSTMRTSIKVHFCCCSSPLDLLIIGCLFQVRQVCKVWQGVQSITAWLAPPADKARRNSRLIRAGAPSPPCLPLSPLPVPSPISPLTWELGTTGWVIGWDGMGWLVRGLLRAPPLPSGTQSARSALPPPRVGVHVMGELLHSRREHVNRCIVTVAVTVPGRLLLGHLMVHAEEIPVRVARHAARHLQKHARRCLTGEAG